MNSVKALEVVPSTETVPSEWPLLLKRYRGAMMEGWIGVMAAEMVRNGLLSLLEGELDLETGVGWSLLLWYWWVTLGDGFVNGKSP